MKIILIKKIKNKSFVNFFIEIIENQFYEKGNFKNCYPKNTKL